MRYAKISVQKNVMRLLAIRQAVAAYSVQRGNSVTLVRKTAVRIATILHVDEMVPV